MGPGRGPGRAGHRRAERAVPVGRGHPLAGDADLAQHHGGKQRRPPGPAGHLDGFSRGRPPAGRRRRRRDPAPDRARVVGQLPHHRRAARRLRGLPSADQACPAR